MSEKKTFFISRAGADKRWAALIASVVRDAGHEAIYQDQDFQVGESFIHNMTKAEEAADCTIAVLSPAYFESEYCLSELYSAVKADPLGERGRLIPVLVEPVRITGPLDHIAYLNLVGVREDSARQRLLTALKKHGQVDPVMHSLRGRTRRVVEHANRNRSAMLEKVRAIWITGFLQKSLFHEVRLLLGLSERLDEVARPMDLLVQRPEQGEQPLPQRTQIEGVFDKMDQALLILGAPGAGKTILLLELARALLDRAEQDPDHQIPVVFPLSSWSQSCKPLTEWMVDELNLRYDVLRAIAEDWVDTDQVMPLLDGLDEVKAEQRTTCAEAINTFRRAHGLLPLVVSSRMADYEDLTVKLRLQGAILVRPLAPKQVTTYLNDLGPAGKPVLVALGDDTSLWELLDTPLMLNIVAVTYSGMSEAPEPLSGNFGERRNRLFESYVDRMLMRRTVERSYVRDQTLGWLSWLARQMAKQGETIFYIERLQRDCLPPRRRALNDITYVLIRGLLFALVSVLFQLPVWIVGALIMMLYTQIDDIPVRETKGVPNVVLITISIFFAFLFAAVGITTGLSDSRYNEKIELAERVKFSLTRLFMHTSSKYKDKILLLITAGLCFGALMPVGHLIVNGRGWVYVIYSALLMICSALLGALIFGLATVFVTMVIEINEGFSISEIELKSYPNQGIIRSLWNALSAMVLFGFIIPLAFALVLSLVDVGFGVAAAVCGVFVGTCVGLRVGLKAGGRACLKHFCLRIWLGLSGSVPWKYVEFLDYADSRILLRKVGGGYAFIHRMLLEYFASRDVDAPDDAMTTTKPSTPEPEI